MRPKSEGGGKRQPAKPVGGTVMTFDCTFRFLNSQGIRARRLAKMGTVVIDNRKYARVLAKVLPRLITTDEEHERMLAEVEKLMDKGEHRAAEEDAALDLMVRLIKDYEGERHPLPDPSPHEMLMYLMEQRSLKQADLLPRS